MKWTPISGHPDYFLNRQGSVMSKRRREPRILKPIEHTGGYLIVVLSSRKKCYVHRLVASEFIPNPKNKPQVNHIDCDPQNNSVENLEWVTPKENSKHMVNLGRQNNQSKGRKGISHNLAKLDELQVKMILEDKEKSPRHLARIFNVSLSLIYQIKNRKIWKHIENTEGESNG